MRVIFQAQSTSNTTAAAKPCCNQVYPGHEKDKCDLDHYCNYTDWKEFERVQMIGVALSIIVGALTVRIWLHTTEVYCPSLMPSIDVHLTSPLMLRRS